MSDPVILNKTQSIERCVKRIEEDYFGFENDFGTNYMGQDAILLNLQRACEQIIDLANHMVKIQELEVPRESKEVFEVLVEANLLESVLADKMKKMIGFRNIAIHEYGKLKMDIVRSIIENHLEDFRRFTRFAVQFI